MKMSNLIGASILMSLTVLPASAGTEQQLEMDFVCTLTREIPVEKDDPLMYTLVHLDAHCPRLKMTVVHVTRYARSSRGAQYINSTNCAGPFEFDWGGAYAKDRNLTMNGSLYLGDDGRWHYDEFLFNHGKPWYRSWTTCTVVQE